MDLLRVFSDYVTHGQCKTKLKKEDKFVLQLWTDISKAGGPFFYTIQGKKGATKSYKVVNNPMHWRGINHKEKKKTPKQIHGHN